MAVYLVCNAHLDPVWLWRWNEGAAEALSTFRTACDFCEEFPGFVFNHNEALLYRWVEEYDPALFARIQRLVKEKKWHIMGGWFLQPDCNMPSGESFARQITRGRRYFYEKFGVRPDTAVNFDSFGHTRGLVQILAKAGYRNYVICRPAPADCPVPGEDFIWKGFDGSEVAVHRADENYNSVLGHAGEKLQSWLESHPHAATGCFLWGVGDHGGGPSRKDLEDIGKLIQAHPERSIRHATPEAYFSELRHSGRPLPEWADSLRPCAVGCYTSQMRVKQAHRQMENALYRVEKMASHAALLGLMEYPSAQLAQAEFDLMASEFHDALPGSDVPSAETDTLQLLNHGLEISDRVRAKAFFALSAGQPPVIPGTTPILVYNPHPFAVETTVDCELVMPAQNWNREFTEALVCQGDRPLPCQTEQEESHFRIDWRKRAVFTARLEPFQMNRFDCRFRALPAKPPVGLHETDGMLRFRSQKLAVDINCRTGLVDRYAADGKEYLAAEAFRPIVWHDGYNSWGGRKEASAHVDSFKLMSPRQAGQFTGDGGQEAPAVRVIEDGAVRTVVEALFEWNRSYLLQRYILPKNGAELGISVTVLWNERDCLLKLTVPAAQKSGAFWGQTAFGSEKLPADGSETVAQRWCALLSEENSDALTIVNDGTYGVNCVEGRIGLTLLRSAAYAASDFVCGPALEPDRVTQRMDQGRHTFSFWVQAGPAAERMAAVEREAAIHNETPCALSFCPSGAGTPPRPLVRIDNPAVVLSAFYRAKGSADYTVRLFNSAAKALTAVVDMPALSMKKALRFTAGEVKTLLLHPAERKMETTGLDGWPEEKSR